MALDLQFVERASSYFGLSEAEFLVNTFHLVVALQNPSNDLDQPGQATEFPDVNQFG